MALNNNNKTNPSTPLDENMLFFQNACQDTARMTSFLAMDSRDIKPTGLTEEEEAALDRAWTSNYYKLLFGYHFKTMITAVMPTRVLGFAARTVLNPLIDAWRYLGAPALARAKGYGPYMGWDNAGFGTSDFTPYDLEQPYPFLQLTSTNTRLAALGMDDKVQRCFEEIYNRGTAVLPHSFDNKLNPDNHDMKGNFYDHLCGTWKALVAWEQPRYVCLGGLYHSVYGTMDYRLPLFNLDQRDLVRSLIGGPAEEISFLLCMADRGRMFGMLEKAIEEGGPNAKLPKEGFEMQNHMTKEIMMIPPRLFANFIVVCSSDLLDQGIPLYGMGDPNQLETMWRISRFKSHVRAAHYCREYLEVMPKIFRELSFMNDPNFQEPSVQLLRPFYQIFDKTVGNPVVSPLTNDELSTLQKLTTEHPYLPEPFLCLARSLKMEGKNDEAQKAAAKAVHNFEILGQPWYKMPSSGNLMKEVLENALEIVNENYGFSKM